MIRYPFIKGAGRAFLEDVLEDVLDRGEMNDIVISYGDRMIAIPIMSETYELLKEFLTDTKKAYDEYEREG